MLVRSKALISADLTDTQNIYVWPLEKFLQGCEVDEFCKYCSICNKNHLKSQFEGEKLHAECVLHHRNILTSRMITPFALADNYDPNDVRENL